MTWEIGVLINISDTKSATVYFMTFQTFSKLKRANPWICFLFRKMEKLPNETYRRMYTLAIQNSSAKAPDGPDWQKCQRIYKVLKDVCEMCRQCQDGMEIMEAGVS